MRKTVAAMGLLASLLACGCAPLVNVMTFFPDRTEKDAVERLPRGVSELFVPTDDGKRLQCFLARNDSSATLLLYFHGNAGNIYQRVFELTQIAACGTSVLGVGYRGYGKSSGRPSERGIYRDGAAAFAYATGPLGYREQDVYVLGRSLGTTVAVRTAADRDLAGLVLITPLTTGRAYARVHGMRAIAFLAGNAFDNVSAAALVRCPTLIIHGSNDEVIPFRMGRELYDSLRGPKRFVEIPGGYHNSLEFDGAALFWSALRKCITRPGCGIDD